MVKISAAHSYTPLEDSPFGTALSGRFGVAHGDAALIVQKAANLDDAIQTARDDSTNNSTGEVDRFELQTPWDSEYAAVKAEIMTLIANGMYGKALDLAAEYAPDCNDKFTDGITGLISNALESLNNHGFEHQVQAFIPFLTDSQLGMDIEFHNTGPNSIGTTDHTGEIRRLRHPIEAHYNNHRHKPEAFVPRFLGVSTGP